jgi:hypothetical protein
MSDVTWQLKRRLRQGGASQLPTFAILGVMTAQAVPVLRLRKQCRLLPSVIPVVTAQTTPNRERVPSGLGCFDASNVEQVIEMKVGMRRTC